MWWLAQCWLLMGDNAGERAYAGFRIGGRRESDDPVPPQAARSDPPAETSPAPVASERVAATPIQPPPPAPKEASGAEPAVKVAAVGVPSVAPLINPIKGKEPDEDVETATMLAALWRKVGPKPSSGAVVFLHGQGETELSWQMALSELQAPGDADGCRWLWPRAEVSPCTARGGAPTTQWFDTAEFPVCRVVRGVPDRSRYDEDPLAVAAAVARLHTVFASLEAEGVPPEQIVVCGFGQGGALALHAALRYRRRLAACVALSAWLPCPEVLAANLTPEGLHVKTLWSHGGRDAVIHAEVAKMQAKFLEDLGLRIDFILYPTLSHGTCAEEMAAFGKFLTERLAAGAPVAIAQGDDG